ncbi:MAG: hypothetical protein WDN69_23280 [Aliidongia sp.]
MSRSAGYEKSAAFTTTYYGQLAGAMPNVPAAGQAGTGAQGLGPGAGGLQQEGSRPRDPDHVADRRGRPA